MPLGNDYTHHTVYVFHHSYVHCHRYSNRCWTDAYTYDHTWEHDRRYCDSNGAS